MNRGVLQTTTGFSKSNVLPNHAPYATNTPHGKPQGVQVTSIVSRYVRLRFLQAMKAPTRPAMVNRMRVEGSGTLE